MWGPKSITIQQPNYTNDLKVIQTVTGNKLYPHANGAWPVRKPETMLTFSILLLLEQSSPKNFFKLHLEKLSIHLIPEKSKKQVTAMETTIYE